MKRNISEDELKFCCAAFGGDYYFSNETGPNIRIVKILELEKNGESVNEKEVLKFFIITGYSNLTFNGTIGIQQINFCPHCGTDLHKFYVEEKYVNGMVNEEFIENIVIKRF